MPLPICASPGLITPTLDRAMKNNIARKAGFKHVHGNHYKERTIWKKFCDFISSTRALNVVGKAHFESKQYCEAAILRKDHKAAHRETTLGRHLTDDEYDEAVWNSNGVQNRLTREDFVRYSQNYYSKEQGATPRNLCARDISNAAHHLHGLCEINAAPTGMTYNGVRNLAAGKVDEKSTKNKVYMFTLLGVIGVATTQLLSFFNKKADNDGTLLGQSITAALIAFPVVSSALGFLGTLAGVASQATVEKQAVTSNQKDSLSKDLSKNLQKLLSQLKVIKDKPELIQVMAKAMQGKYHLTRKIKADSLDELGVPIILNRVLEAIDPALSDLQNMRAMQAALGAYLQVEKPEGDDATLWQRYRYAKAVTNRESHYVALISTVDHMEVSYPHAKELQDLRRYTEEKGAPFLHDQILKILAHPASFVDRFASTKIAPTLRKWASDAYRNRQSAKMSNPARAAKNCFTGQYMANNIHQYGPVTRCLLKISEGIRIVNMNVVLASNANTSRVFNNGALQIHRSVGCGPPSRCMCNSVGRFFGGATLAAIFGLAIPIAADATGGSTTLDTKGALPFNISLTNIGILMFILSVPTLMVQGLAQVTARLEGWEGNIKKTPPENVRTFEFSR